MSTKQIQPSNWPSNLSSSHSSTVSHWLTL
jgi:hypothetical protein